MTPRLLLLIPFALLACASAPPATPPPATPAAPAAPAAAPVSPPSPPPAPVAAPAGDPPSARVVQVVPSKDDVPYVRAQLLFSNPSSAACRVLGYKLVWGAASKAITLKDLTLPPGETRERWLKVSPGDGDLAALKPESGRIELQTECAR